MNKGTSFLNRIPWPKQSSRSFDPEPFLDALGQPAILIDSPSWIIRYANTGAVDYTNFTRSELVGMDLRSLFTDWDESQIVLENNISISNSTVPQRSLRLLRHDQVPVLSKVTLSKIRTNDGLGLILLEEVEQPVLKEKRDLDAGLLRLMIDLLASINTPELQASLQKACDIMKEISSGEQVIIYHLMGETPVIHRIAQSGKQILLPEKLDMHDLVTLNSVRYWEPGKHPSCNLYRNARASNIRYLASAPLGQNSALIGLAVIAGSGNPPAKPLIEIVSLFASVITAIFESSAYHEAVGNKLRRQSQITSRMSVIAGQVQEGIMQLSPDLRIRGINPRLEEILGFSSREIEGQDVGKILIGNEKLPLSLLNIQNVERSNSLGDVRLFRRDGHPFQALVRISPVMINEELDEIEIFVQDLTEKEQIRAHAQELENRAWLGELMAVFAHEVRNPINNISTGLQLMSMHTKSDNAQQATIGRMLQDCDRLEQLVKSVLGFSKPIEYQMESLDLGVLLQRLFDRQRLKLSNPRIRLDLQIDPKSPRVSGHMRSLEQVFNNLVTNAIQAMGENEGVITIKLASGTVIEGIPYVDIFVADNGPGIPKDVQEKIFQPFLTTKQNGTGLGLSIAKRIITAHKGNIQLSSFPGGTIFHIQLPAAEDETRTE